MHRAKKGQVLVLLAPGFEEADVSKVTRILRRASLPVVIVGLMAGPIRGAYGVLITPDATLSEVEGGQVRAVVVPGGTQAVRQLNADPRVHALLRQVVEQGGYVMVLDMAQAILQGAGMWNGAEEQGSRGAEEGVVVNGQAIVGWDSGAVEEAALTLVAVLEGRGRCPG